MPQFEMGYGSYSMKGLKELNKNMLIHAPVSSVLLSDFPSGWYYRPSLMLKYNILNLGAVYTYQHTYSEIWGKK